MNTVCIILCDFDQHSKIFSACVSKTEPSDRASGQIGSNTSGCSGNEPALFHPNAVEEEGRTKTGLEEVTSN